MLARRALSHILLPTNRLSLSMAYTSREKYTEPASDESFSTLPDVFNISEEQMAALDVQTAEDIASTVGSTSALPAIHIALEEAEILPVQEKPAPLSRTPSSSWTPMSKFRWHGRLSVTDLAGPAWCEVQFEYGLLGKRNLKLDKRPTSFTSRDGLEITLKKAVAAKNDVALIKGKTIHKKLELQVRPEAVPVTTKTNEEAWALRLINFISCLKSLVLTNMTREIPVFGMVNGQVVTGVIDEITCREPRKRPADAEPGTPRKPKKAKADNEPSPGRQSQLDTFLVINPGSKRPSSPPQIPHYIIRISDSKTRQTDTLPDDADTLPAKVQLMVYQRMLNRLVSQDLARQALMSLWGALGLNLTRGFSGEFMAQVVDSIQQEPEDDRMPGTLNELADLLQITLLQLGTFEVDSTLEIVYRSQSSTRFTRLKKGKGKEKQTVMDAVSASDDATLAMAIRESLLDVGVPDDKKGETSAVLLKELQKAAAISDSPEAAQVVSAVENSSSESSSTSSALVDPSILAAQEALFARLASGSNFAAEAGTETETDTETETETTAMEDSKEAGIIGVKKFEIDIQFLDRYLDDVLAWWNGRRRPRGVDASLTRRCSNCEYIEDCEWRQQKSIEITEARRAGPSQKQRRQALEARRLAEQSATKQ